MQHEQPWCVYCGMAAFGTSVDHMPPIAIFDNRERPKGMEYLACSDCHNGTRSLDLLAGLLSRIYPDSSSPQGRAEIASAFRGLRNNFPALFDELAADPEEMREALVKARAVFPNATGALAIGPRMHALLARFAARVGLALHYDLCRQVVPAAGAVLVRVFSNASLVDGVFPSDFAALLGDPRTLRQGSKSAEDQFSYASKALDDLSISAHIATFRMSFAVQAFVARDATAMAPPEELGPDVDVTDRLFRPGFLKQPADT
jgi:hypothetical protein